VSCDTNTHKVTVLGDLDIDHKGRHRRDDDDHDRHEFTRDLVKALRDGDAHRDIVREVLEAKYAGIRETLESKAAILAAIAETRVQTLESENRNLRDLFEFAGRRKERCGGHD
jgi:hypothetical protein